MLARAKVRWIVPLLAALAMPRPPAAAAQTLGSVLGGVLAAVTDIDANYILGRATGRGRVSGDAGLSGLGIEATLVLDRWGRSRCPSAAGPAARAPRSTPEASRSGPAVPTRTLDTTLTQIRVHHALADGTDSVRVYAVTKSSCTEDDPLWALELGIGYVQMRGFRGDTLALRGSLEELPLTSVYFVLNPNRTFSPYFGASGGLAQLKDFKATNGDSGLAAAGATFEYGLVAGLAAGPSQGRWSFFLEGRITWRRFDGVTWTGRPVPAVLFAPLDLSTLTVALGGQFSFGKGKPAS